MATTNYLNFPTADKKKTRGWRFRIDTGEVLDLLTFIGFLVLLSLVRS